MPTVVYNVMSVAFPSITNRIQASVFLQSDPQAFIASQIDSTPGHPARVWSFPGLPRNNYSMSIDEIDGGGTIVRNIAFFFTVPSELDGSLNRDDEQIQVDNTPGLVSGVNVASFDGSSGAPDYRGWEIVVSEYDGVGILVRDALDFTWDKDTGLFNLIQFGDVFAAGQWYNVHFNSQDNPAGNSYPTVTDFNIRLITSGNSLAADFGNKLIVEPDDVYIEVNLPPILTVPPGRKMMVEVGTGGIDVACANFISVDATINFLRSRLMAYPNESFSIYRFQRGVGDNEWRVCDEQGNFANVGMVVADDSIASNVFNRHPMNGESVETIRYARLYNEVVLNLPLGAACHYDEWTADGNRTKYSLDDSSNPSAAGHFHFPERIGYFEKSLNTGFAGQFEAQNVGEFDTNIVIPKTNESVGGNMAGRLLSVGIGGNPPNDSFPIPVTLGSGENVPNNYLINKYILI